jgi:hypothetical protein
MMKILGMLFVLFSAIAFSVERSIAEERRLKVLEELYRFIECVKIEIGCYLRPISEIASDFLSDPLSELGFFSELEHNGIFSAYRMLDSKVRFPEDARKLFERFFPLLGNGYVEDQLKLIGGVSAELSEIIKRERTRVPKQKKLSVTLSCAAALALLEDGKFSLDDNIADYLPAFSDMKVKRGGGIFKAENPIKIFNLFTMTGGLSYDAYSEEIKRGKEETEGRCPTVEMIEIYCRDAS